MRELARGRVAGQAERMDARGWIAHLGLGRHPEGGHDRETYRAAYPEQRALIVRLAARSA